MKLFLHYLHKCFQSVFQSDTCSQAGPGAFHDYWNMPVTRSTTDSDVCRYKTISWHEPEPVFHDFLNFAASAAQELLSGVTVDDVFSNPRHCTDGNKPTTGEKP